MKRGLRRVLAENAESAEYRGELCVPLEFVGKVPMEAGRCDIMNLRGGGYGEISQYGCSSRSRFVFIS